MKKSSMKIFITGGSGLLGQYLNQEFSDYNIITTFNKHRGNCEKFNSLKLDLTDFAEVERVISSIKPDVIIHSAAYTSPVKNESISPSFIYNINVKATEKLALLSSRLNCRMIYISTDLVYAGYRGSMLKEDAKLIPASLYAETKLMGEVKVKEFAGNFLILRLALLYGFGLNHSVCHFQEIYRRLSNNEKVCLFTDQFRTPVSLKDASRLIKDLTMKNVKNEIINVGGNQRTSRFELGEILCKIAGFDKSLLVKTSMKNIPGYPAVEDVSLNTDKLKSFGIAARSIEENIKELIKISINN